MPYQCEAAKLQHLEDLQSLKRVSRRDRKSLRRFASIWVDGKAGRVSARFPASTSASFGSGRAAGGMTAEVREAVKSLKSRLLTTALASDILRVSKDLPYVALTEGQILSIPIRVESGDEVGERLFPYLEVYSFTGVGPQEWEYLTVHLYGYIAMMLRTDSLIRRFRTSGDLPLARQVVIEERGMKTRIVTPITGCIGYASSFINGVLMCMLNKDPRLRADSQDPLEDCITRMSGGGNLLVRSVDMSRASDLIPHSVALSLAEGIIDGWGLSPFLADVFRLTVGPHRMVNSEGKWFTTTSAILMGSGTTWPLLSLYNLWLWEGAWTEAGKRGRSALVRKRVRVVGDDLLGLSPRVVSDTYTQRLLRTGGSPSFGKDMLSSKYGVLVEQVVSVRTKPVPTMLYSVSVRSIQPVSRVERDGASRPAWALGPSLDTVFKKLGSPRWFYDYINTRYSSELSALRQNGLPPYLPREFGGGGFPSLDSGRGAIASLRPKWARALRCAMSQGPGGESYLNSLSSSWTDRYEKILSSFEQKFWRSAQVEALASTLQIELGEGGDNNLQAQDTIQLAESAVSAALRLSGVGSVREVPLSLSRVSGRLQKAIDSLNELVPYPRLTDTPRDLTSGLESYLLEGPRRQVSRHGVLSVANCMSVDLVGTQDVLALMDMDFI
jgi:hypothetical protein